MIQRIQSVFLALVVIISIVLFFVPISEKDMASTEGNTKSELAITGTKTGDEIRMTPGNYILMIMNGLILALSAFIIFKYNNRMMQINLCMLAGILTAGMLLLSFYFSGKLEPADQQPHYLMAIYLIVVQMGFLLAARRAITRDEKMVRAADRIR